MVGFSNKSLGDFRLIIISPPPTLTDKEKDTTANSFEEISQDKSIEMKVKIILTHVLRHCNENKSISHPNTSIIRPPEHVAISIFSID